MRGGHDEGVRGGIVHAAANPNVPATVGATRATPRRFAPAPWKGALHVSSFTLGVGVGATTGPYGRCGDSDRGGGDDHGR